MSDTYLTTKQVADVFGVAVETVRQWRDREPLCPSSPLRLIGEGTANSYRYTPEQIMDFAYRNPKYLHCVAALAYAPADLLLPRISP